MLLEFIFKHFSSYWGPLRMLSSITVLSFIGLFTASLLTFLLLPRFWHLVTRDKGRKHAHDAKASIGKPLGVGILMNLIFVAMVLILVPWDPRFYLSALAILIASAIGLADDTKPGGFSEMILGTSDLALSILVCMAIFYGRTVHVWFPFTSIEFEVSYWAAILIFTPTIWMSVNALNCNDGVDGLSGTLAVLTLITLGIIIYSVVGHVENSRYLRIPHNSNVSAWVIGTAIMCGIICGYLWHNAPPSAALMGDAGSRPIGLFVGMLIAITGNPVIILFVAPMILVNGATGLLKVGMIRVFRIHILRTVSFPLHDHMRKSLHWSNSQVLLRFALVHIAALSFLLLILIKLR